MFHRPVRTTLLTLIALTLGFGTLSHASEVALRSPGWAVEPGGTLSLDVEVTNSTPRTIVAEIYVAVALGDELLFWPSFTPTVSVGTQVTVSGRKTQTVDILDIPYLDAVAQDFTTTWYALAVNRSTQEVIGELSRLDLTLLNQGVQPSENFVNPRFEPDAMETDFYALPFPSDMRFTDGVLDIGMFPNPTGNFWVNMIVDMSRDERDGFALNNLCLFQFDGEVRTGHAFTNGETLDADNPSIWVVNVDPDSPEYGRKYPVEPWYWKDADPYMPGGHVLSIAPHWGATFLPDTTYACIIFDGLRDGRLNPVGSPTAFQRSLAGIARNDAESKAAWSNKPLADYLRGQNIDRKDVLIGSVFTTWDPAGRFQEVYNDGVENYVGDINTPLVLTRTLPEYYVLEGTIDFPQFQQGTPPFSNGGTFSYYGDGSIRQTGTAEAKVVLTLPRSPMPAEGYPLMFWVHGSGGVPIDVVDRGRQPAPGAPNTAGEGPARYLAQAGMASVAISMPVNPERLPGASSFEYLNFVNFRATRGNFRQGTIELGLLRKLMDTLQLDASSYPDTATGGQPIRFDRGHYAVMGQSMGAMYTTFFGALEPSLKVAVPTGAGGFWPLMLMYITELPGRDLLNVLFWINNPDLNEFHPVLALGQHALEHVDPIVMVPHMMRRPLPGVPPKSVFYPAGYIDAYFHPEIISAWSVSMGLPVAGPLVEPQLAEDLARVGYQHFDYPVANNVVAETGEVLTGVINQWEEDSIDHGHYVTFQLDGPKYQYRCFLQSWLETGVPTVYAPGDLSSPCP